MLLPNECSQTVQLVFLTAYFCAGKTKTKRSETRSYSRDDSTKFSETDVGKKLHCLSFTLSDSVCLHSPDDAE